MKCVCGFEETDWDYIATFGCPKCGTKVEVPAQAQREIQIGVFRDRVEKALRAWDAGHVCPDEFIFVVELAIKDYQKGKPYG